MDHSSAALKQNVKRILVVFVAASNVSPADSHRRRDFLQQVSAAVYSLKLKTLLIANLALICLNVNKNRLEARLKV